MSEQTGLGWLELSVLAAVTPAEPRGLQRTTVVLGRLEDTHGFGPSYAVAVARDLGVPWQTHLPLLMLDGNWGSRHGDPMADPRYTELGLTEVGELALASQAGACGAVPLSLIEGSLYRGGLVPPFAPAAVVAAVRAVIADPALPDRRVLRLLGPPTAPTGGPYTGQLAALLAGRPSRLRQSSTVLRESDDRSARVVVVDVPLGVRVDDVADHLGQRARHLTPGQLGRGQDYLTQERRDPPPNAASELGMRDVQDESSQRAGIRVVVRAAPDADLDKVEAWMRSVWPVTVEIDALLPAPAAELVRTWSQRCQPDPSGLDALATLTGTA